MRKITILLLIILISSIGCLSGCTKEPTGENESNPKSNIIISSYASRTGYEGIDYVLYIDVVVQNTGEASGTARVWSEVNQDSSHYEKHQDVYVETGKTYSFTFRYTEFSYWSVDTGTYRVWIE
jgi:hypothetical protein